MLKCKMNRKKNSLYFSQKPALAIIEWADLRIRFLSLENYWKTTEQGGTF